MKKWNFLILVLVMSLAITYYPRSSQAGRVLDLGDSIGGPPDVPQRIILEYFSSEVTKRTNGDLTIKYHPQTIVTSETKAVEMCKGGALAFCAIGGQREPSFPMCNPSCYLT